MPDGLGKPIAAPPLIRQISKDPVLKDVKLIAEPWDLGMYQVNLKSILICHKYYTLFYSKAPQNKAGGFGGWHLCVRLFCHALSSQQFMIPDTSDV